MIRLSRTERARVRVSSASRAEGGAKSGGPGWLALTSEDDVVVVVVVIVGLIGIATEILRVEAIVCILVSL